MAYTTPTSYTSAQILAHIDEAIVAVLAGGQSVTIAGKTITRPSLDALRAMRSECAQTVAAEAAVTGNNIAIVQRGERY